MIELEMHCSSGYYYDEKFIPCPFDPVCCDCPHMPDNECGWGYQYVNECIFRIEKGTPYWYDAYDTFLNERFNDPYLTPEPSVQTLVDLLELAASLHMVVDEWNWKSQRDKFLDDTWLLRKKVNEYGYEIKTGHDYILWTYNNEPCAVCGKITEKFVLYGDVKQYGAYEKVGNVIKLCEYCSDSNWMSSYNR